MSTQAEVEAASSAIVNANDEVSPDTAAFLATVALEAAERVRPPRRDPTNALRQRRYKAKRRNVTASGAAPRNVTEAARPVTANVTRLASAIGNATSDVTDNVTGPALPSLNLSELVALRDRLLEAAAGNVQPGATDLSAVERLLAQGCDLDLDVLPAVHDLLTDPLQPPLKSWGLPWLAAEIVRRRDARMASDRVTRAPAAARTAPVPRRAAERAAPPPPQRPPAALSFDMDELVAGYRAGYVAWDATRFGPPPGSPGCRVDAGILRANGYR